MSQIYIAVGERGCQLANELRAIAIIVDALRASATLASLFERGIIEAWVVSEVEQAWELKRQMQDVLLVGERNSVKVEGFNFGNSPTEILQTKDLFKRRVIFTSTTGARRILECQSASAILVGSTVNATAVAKVAKNLAEQRNSPVVIVASGVYGHSEEWALEDIAAAWVIADRVGFAVSEAPTKPEGQLEEIFASSLHGQELIALGLEADVHWCSQVDVVSAVPQVSEFTEFTAILHSHSPSP